MQYTTVIKRIREVALLTTEVTFQRPDDFIFKAGQHLRLSLSELRYPDPKGNSRDFSIVSSPNNKKELTIAFRNSESGFKKTLCELTEGTPVSLEGPFGRFVLPASDRPIVLVAGGIGVTPCMSMATFACEGRLPLTIRVLYATTDPKRAAYLDELDRLETGYERFSVKRRFGDITQSFLVESTKDLTDPIWYVVGPPGMVMATKALLVALQVSDQDMLLEEMSGYAGGVHLSSIPQTEDGSGTSLSSTEILHSSILETLDNTALVTVTDANGDILFVNNKFVEVSKYTRDELLGQNHRLMKSGYHTHSFYENFWETISGGKIWRGEIKNRAKDGTFYWVDTSLSPVYGDAGKIVAYLAVGFPITDKKDAEEQIRSEAKKLRKIAKDIRAKNDELEKVRKATLNILEDLDEEKRAVEQKVIERTQEIEAEKEKLLQVTSNMKAGGILFDTEREPVFINNAAHVMLECQESDSPTDVVHAFIHTFKDANIDQYLERCFSGESFEVPELDNEKGIYQIFFHALSQSGTNEKYTGYFILFFDITESKLLERSKSELVAVASHQLRTPLTAMRGNVEMLLDESFGPINEDQREMLGDIQASTARLIIMVNDMLDITKIERGDIEMEQKLLDLPELIDAIIKDLGDYAQRQKFMIRHHKPEGTVQISGDVTRLRQVFQNLIDNSIKYNRYPGTLDIEYKPAGKTVEVVFKDNGIGIPKDELPHIFGRFYRASNTSNIVSGGSGLGLYIVRSIIELHGGAVRLESKENVGTTLYVSLPIVKDYKHNT